MTEKRQRETQKSAFLKHGAGEGIYLGDNEQARAVESTIYRKKPTPETKKDKKCQN